MNFLETELKRRRPGTHDSAQAAVVSSRQEEDVPEILSGIFAGFTLGTPIAILVRNLDARPDDYKAIAENPRPGHADDVWSDKFGRRDHRGGGRASGRETVARVMAGAVAQMFLRHVYPGLRAYAFASQIAHLKLKQQDYLEIKKRYQTTTPPPSNSYFDQFAARFPSPLQAVEVEKLLADAKDKGRSYGGLAELWIENAPASLGQPVFRKLKADLAGALMGIGATSAVEVGDGFASALAEGSQFHGQTNSQSNSDQYGGIRGGISTGDRILLRVAFKPTSSVLDVAKQGRHDPCIIPRAVPVLEAMANLVLADHVLWARTDQVGN
jgi:chorismate synthase